MEVKKLNMELPCESLSNKYNNQENHILSPRSIADEYHEGENIEVSLDISSSKPATFLNLNIKPNKVVDFSNLLKNSEDAILESISKDIDKKVNSRQKEEEKSSITVYIGYDAEGKISDMSHLILE